MTIIENKKVVTCPICGSDNIKKVHPFDYAKQCNDDSCNYYIENYKKRRYQFSTGVHN
jgi:hypothetical protein